MVEHPAGFRLALAPDRHAPQRSGLHRWLAALLLAGMLLVPAARSPRPAGAAGPFAYLGVLNHILVLDTTSNTVVATIPMAVTPAGVAMKPDGTRVYVGDNNANTVSVIDTSTNTLLATIPVGADPEGVAVNSVGTRVYVDNVNSGSVSVIDTSSNSVAATITTGSQPHGTGGVAVNPTGSRVYVTDYFAHAILVIDTGLNAVVASIPLNSGPEDVAVTPDGTRLYVTYQFATGVSVIDTGSNTVVDTVPTARPTFSVVVNPAGTRVYVTGGSGIGDTVLVIDTATDTVVATIPVGDGPTGVAVSPTGTRVYVVNTHSGSVSAIDPSSNAVTATIPLGQQSETLGRFIGPVIPNVSSTTTLSAAPNPASAGKPLTLKATVSCTYAPSGSVAFTEGGTPLGSGTLNSAGVASATTSSLLSDGPHTITAAYGGDNNCNPGSATTSVTVVAQTISLSPAGAQYSDQATLQATVSGLTLGTLSTGGAVQFSLNGSPVGSPVSLPATAVSGGQLVFTLPATVTLPPGQYSIGAAFTPTDTADFNTVSATLAHGLTVTAEDARVTYTGDTMAWTAPGGGGATLFLATTIKDISAVPADPATDGFPGDIRTATVKFVDRGTGNATLCTAPVLLVSAGTQQVGSASCTATVSLGAQSSLSLTVGTVVGGNYTRDSSADNAAVTVSKARSGATVYANGALQSSQRGGALAPPSGPLTASLQLQAAYTAGASSPTGSLSLTFAANGRVTG
jgi:YVTN family beta-propeller protein